MMNHRLRVFSRHPSHRALREAGVGFPFKVLIRLGSTTVPHNKYKIEINSPESVRTSASKLLMKQAFTKAGVPTAKWWTFNDLKPKEIEFPIVAKYIYGSRGTGNYLLKDIREFNEWVKGKDTEKYIFEEFFSGNREYRLHVSELGCFYTNRKMLKNGADKRWARNNENCVWIREDNPLFDKPSNWATIVKECQKALKAVGLDVAAFDVKVQSTKDKEGRVREFPNFIIIESNSAPSFGEITLQMYKAEIPRIVNHKL